jgi:mannose-6-phosphate isomerase-like protein (cupin superfamily)
MALSDNQPTKVIGVDALLKDKPGFEVDFLSRNSITSEMRTHNKPTVLMPFRGHWKLRLKGRETIVNPGDTCLIRPGEEHAITPSMTGEASLFRVRTTNDPAGLTKTAN